MRCKQGDLAVVVRSTAGNEGKIVKCLKLTHGRLFNPNGSYVEGNLWEIEPELKTWSGSRSHLAPDIQLRPIRPSEGQDETLSWKDVPQEELA